MIEYITSEVRKIPWRERRQVEKKILPEYYQGLLQHTKMFEIRSDEDDIKPGDILVLREWDGEYTGHLTMREVTCVLRDIPEYGLKDGFCILSLQTPEQDRKPVVGCDGADHIIHCKDCRWFDAGENDSESWSVCTCHFGKYFDVSEYDFCSFARKR